MVAHKMPERIRAAARCEFTCICIDAYKDRNLEDPSCRCADFERALDMAWEAMHVGGYALVFMSKCWCEGKETGSKHTPGCPGIEQEKRLSES